MPAASRATSAWPGVIVPLYPGVYSAIGLLMSDVKHDYVRSRMTPIDELTPDDVERACSRGWKRRRARTCAPTAFRDDQIGIERALDMRYAGQGYEITMPCDAAAAATAASPRCARQFDAAAQARCSATWRPRSRSRSCPIACAASAWCRRSSCRSSSRPARRSTMRCARPARVRFDGVTIDCPVYQREQLDVGLTLRGTGHPRSVRLHHRRSARPDRARRRMEEHLIVTTDEPSVIAHTSTPSISRSSRRASPASCRRCRTRCSAPASPPSCAKSQDASCALMNARRRGGRAARRAAAAYRRVSGLLRRRASRSSATTSRRATPS